MLTHISVRTGVARPLRFPSIYLFQWASCIASLLLITATIAQGQSAVTPIPKNPQNLINVNGTLFFTADDGLSGRELWKSDGTAAGTVLVKDVTPGSQGTTFGQTVPVGSNLYFTANFSVREGEYTRSYLYEIWKSDGTAAGTKKITTVSAYTDTENNYGYVPGTIFAFKESLFYTQGDFSGFFLYRLDEADKSILIIGFSVYHSQFPGYNFTDVNGTLFFSVNTSLTYDPSAKPYELWKSDGTAAGTILLLDELPVNPANLTTAGNLLFFTADDGLSGRELWKSDGTAAGTVLVKDVTPGSDSTDFRYFASAGNKVYFTANYKRLPVNEIPGETTTRYTYSHELWQSDGTEAGTKVIDNFSITLDIEEGTPKPDALFTANGRLYYTSKPYLNFTLNSINPASGTQSYIGEFEAGEYDVLAKRGATSNQLFFVENGLFESVDRLWRTDGTSVVQVKDDFSARNLIGVGNTLFCTVYNDKLKYHELWKSDGTEAGTVPVFQQVSTNKILFYRAINLNGPAQTIDGHLFEASASAPNLIINGGRAFANQNVTLNPATDAARAQMIRSSVYGTNSTVTISVTNVPSGDYEVYAYVWEDNNPANYYFSVEGQTMSKNSGAKGSWEKLGPFRVNITDGNIYMFSAGYGNISGIEIYKREPDFYRAVNLNGEALTIDGKTFESGNTATNFSATGKLTNKQYITLTPGTDANRAKMIKSSIYNAPGNQATVTFSNVPTGVYEVYAYTWEDNNAETFSLLLEGQTVLANYNSGKAGSWKKLGPFRSPVTDGSLNLSVTGGYGNLSGVEVYQVSKTSSTARLTAQTLEIPEAGNKVTVYPNPFTSKLNVTVGGQTGKAVITLVDLLGRTVYQGTHSSNSGIVELSSPRIKPGVYLLKVQTETGASQTVRVVKQ